MNIVICDDDNGSRKAVIKVVKSFMEENKKEYKIFEYDDYNSQFNKMIKTKSKKVYILDIETPSASGIDIARQIRKEDTESVIIFVTGHEEYGKILLKRNLMSIGFINKFEDLKYDLRNALTDACHFLKNDKIVKIYDRSVTYNIRLSKVLYITKDTVERKTIIKLDNQEYKVNLTLKEVVELFDENLIQTHRCCFVNKNRVEKIDHKNKTITFDNCEVIDLLSNNYGKELK